MFSIMLSQFTAPVSLAGRSDSATSFILLFFTGSILRGIRGSRKDKHSAKEPCTTEILDQSQQVSLEPCCKWQLLLMCVHSATTRANADSRKKAYNHFYLPSFPWEESRAALFNSSIIYE